MEIDTAAVKEVGSKHYPDLAGAYKEAATGVSKYTEGVLSAIAHHDGLHKKLEELSSNLYKFLDESSSHLNRCGEVLVDMSDELKSVDGDNAHNIDDSSEGFDDK